MSNLYPTFEVSPAITEDVRSVKETTLTHKFFSMVNFSSGGVARANIMIQHEPLVQNTEVLNSILESATALTLERLFSLERPKCSLIQTDAEGTNSYNIVMTTPPIDRLQQNIGQMITRISKMSVIFNCLKKTVTSSFPHQGIMVNITTNIFYQRSVNDANSIGVSSECDDDTTLFAKVCDDYLTSRTKISPLLPLDASITDIKSFASTNVPDIDAFALAPEFWVKSPASIYTILLAQDVMDASSEKLLVQRYLLSQEILEIKMGTAMTAVLGICGYLGNRLSLSSTKNFPSNDIQDCKIYQPMRAWLRRSSAMTSFIGCTCLSLYFFSLGCSRMNHLSLMMIGTTLFGPLGVLSSAIISGLISQLNSQSLLG